MSAIVGLFYRDGRPVDPADLQRMVDILAHRGPDGCGLWHDGAIGLGHRMLWTTPESLHERLPLVNRRGDLVITADARIDNRDELIPLVGLGDRPAAEIADSEVILAAYETWGEACPEKLLGDFAFAIWDARHQKLFCARDHFGVKPFYYYLSDDMFIFGTEIKAVLCVPEVPRQLNEIRVAEYMTYMFQDAAGTFYQHVHRLPPGHTLRASRQIVSVQQYWSLDPHREVCLSSDQEYAEAFKGLFTEAVRCRLRSAYPIGSMLSGGLDSSSVACVARDLLAQAGRGPLHTFSAIFDTVRKCDEREYIYCVLARGGFEPHWVHGDQAGPLSYLDEMFWHCDETPIGPNLFLHWTLYKAVRDNGIRVLLDGHDGDGTVSHGFQYLDELAAAHRWSALVREARGVAALYNESPAKLLWAYGRQYAVKPLVSRFGLLRSSRRAWHEYRAWQRGTPQPTSTAPSWAGAIQPSFAERVELHRQRKVWLDANVARTERQSHLQLLNSPLQALAFDVIDTSSGAFGIDTRHPFADKRLVEFCVALPPQQKLHSGLTRVILRRAMAGIVPSEVLRRRDKMDFNPLLLNGLLNYRREVLDELLLNDVGPVIEYVDIDAMRQLYPHQLPEPGGAAGRDMQAFWRGASLGLWLAYAWTGGATKSPQQDTAVTLHDRAPVAVMG